MTARDRGARFLARIASPPPRPALTSAEAALRLRQAGDRGPRRLRAGRADGLGAARSGAGGAWPPCPVPWTRPPERAREVTLGVWHAPLEEQIAGCGFLSACPALFEKGGDSVSLHNGYHTFHHMTNSAKDSRPPEGAVWFAPWPTRQQLEEQRRRGCAVFCRDDNTQSGLFPSVLEGRPGFEPRQEVLQGLCSQPVYHCLRRSKDKVKLSHLLKSHGCLHH
ncbi:uncharacterized protein LOC131393985 [Diceros bicornis minor]|uniref:uncharacterized protein LOC131393985 n=1 Tax=Diceros bicornis minor TaxID=77932 RepID=UPI0026EC8BE2|nr:uncharacterized protein LOC131393985 [Diceros bicornis minor]